MFPTIILILFILVGAGVLHYLLGRAPFIDPPYKGAAQWVILAVAVVWVVVLLYGLIQGVT